MSTLSTAWLEAMNTCLVNATKGKFEELLLHFTQEVATELKVDRERLCAIWNRVAPDCEMNLKASIERETREKEAEIRKHKRMEERKAGPKCQYPYGPKSKKPDQLCGDWCKIGTPGSDGKDTAAPAISSSSAPSTSVTSFMVPRPRRPGSHAGLASPVMPRPLSARASMRVMTTAGSGSVRSTRSR